jgi:16S rRNA U516 pseudouridylate synthase RsuA-like enzyme
VGQEVLGLQRIRIAGIRLGKLGSGKWRFLDSCEIEALTVDR